MHSRRICMQLMASEASRSQLTAHDYISNVAQDMAVARVQALVVSLCKINFVVLEQIVARDEVIRIRQTS